MGKRECLWQDKRYVLSFFGKSLSIGRDNYYTYVKDGLDQGRRPELVGGGLIRSLGGWAEARRLRLKGQDRVKGDERILGDGDFVMNILSEANERMDRRYELKSLGYDLDKVERRVLEIYRIEREELYSKGRQKIRAEARGLFCYWAVRELGYGQAELARRLSMTQPGVGYAVQRGEHIVKENNLLIEK
jgi:putative transposase